MMMIEGPSEHTIRPHRCKAAQVKAMAATFAWRTEKLNCAFFLLPPSSLIASDRSWRRPYALLTGLPQSPLRLHPLSRLLQAGKAFGLMKILEL